MIQTFHGLSYNAERWDVDPDGDQLIRLPEGRRVVAVLQTEPHSWPVSVNDPADLTNYRMAQGWRVTVLIETVR